MDFKDRLDFAKKTTNSSAYSSQEKLELLDFQHFIYSLRSSVESYASAAKMDGSAYFRAKYLCDIQKHHITLCNHRRFFGQNKWILGLDCDSAGDKGGAVEFLRSTIWGRNHVVIESSPGRYWIVCDFIGIMQDISDRLDETPGVDPLFVRCCKEKKYINFRAYPKNGFVPIFENWSELITQPCSLEYEQWVRDFHSYWHSDEMTHVSRRLQEAHEIMYPNVISEKDPVAPIPHVPITHCLDRFEV